MQKIALGAALLPLLVWAEEPAPAAFGSSFSQTAFLPDIALILDTNYVSRSITDAAQPDYTLLGMEYPEYVENSPDNGFNLNYAELAMASTVDRDFDLNAVFHFNTEGVEIEEAYFTTRRLPWDLRLKGGKFKSEFGYLNAKHQHMWSFENRPLVYTAFLSPEGINSAGLQLQWLAPTPWYMMAGVELMQTGNGASFSNDSYQTDLNTTVSADTPPALTVGYLKNSFDIDDTTVLLGLSAATGANKNEAEAFDGSSTVYGIDLLVKRYFDSYSHLAWQSELLYRDKSGTDTLSGVHMAYRQAGAYTQLVYAYNQNWHTGVRYDSIFKNDRNGIDDNTNRYQLTVMGEYDPSEFSRIRLQYSHDRAFKYLNGPIKSINTFIVEANFAIGAHGAHSF